MHARTSTRLGSVLAGVAVSAMALSGPASAAAKVITVPDDFVPALSDTRATGHHEVVETGLRVWTEGSTSTDKVAEYVATATPLAGVGEPTLAFDNNSQGGTPGYQLVVDFDGDGSADGTLVGEKIYGNDWWVNNSAKQFVKDGAPSHDGGSGSANHGTLDGWRASFPKAQVQAFGFSLGSGVKGDGIITSLTLAGDTYTFARAVVLSSKQECKNGGWATSTKPVFKNQGDCVSHFASGK